MDNGYLEQLPDEIFENIALCLSVRDLSALSVVSKGVNTKLGRQSRVWEHHCEILNIKDWRDHDDDGNLLSWHDVFLKYLRVRLSFFRDEDVEKYRMYYDMTLLEANLPIKLLNDGCGEICNCLTLESDSTELKKLTSTLINSKLEEDVVTDSVISYAFDEHYFVLVQTVVRETSTTMFLPNFTGTSIAVWDLTEPALELEHNISSFDFEIAAQDVTLWKGYLILLPLRIFEVGAEEDGSTLVEVRDLDHPTLKQISSYKVPFPKRRRFPQVYKESGANRVHAYEEKLLVVVPCHRWTIFVFSLAEVYRSESLALLTMHELDTVPLHLFGPFYVCDGKESQFLCTFFSVDANVIENLPDDLRNVRTMNVTIDLDQPEGNMIQFPFMPRVVSKSFNISGRVGHMRLYQANMTAWADCEVDGRVERVHHRSRKRKPNEKLYPVFVILLANGQLVVQGKAEKKAHCPIDRKHREVDWHHNEIIVHESTIVVMKRFDRGPVLYAVDLHTLELKWEFPLFGDNFSLELTQRYFLSFGLSSIWLANAERVYFFEPSTGQVQGHLDFPPYRRMMPEIKMACTCCAAASCEDMSPYAQTGFSIWEIAAIKNKMIVIHDLERVCPVLFDLYEPDQNSITENYSE